MDGLSKEELCETVTLLGDWTQGFEHAVPRQKRASEKRNDLATQVSELSEVGQMSMGCPWEGARSWMVLFGP